MAEFKYNGAVIPIAQKHGSIYVLFDEDRRLEAVAEYGIVPDGAQAAIGPIIDLAATIFGVPTALVSIVGRDETLFAGRRGIEICSIAREVSFCTHVVEREDALVVLDTLLDHRFVDHPLVTGPAQVRFYAGVPLRAPSGHAVGSFCLIDTRPRSSFRPKELTSLEGLAALALDRLELIRLEKARVAGQVRFEQIAASSADGIVCADGAGVIRFWNAAAEALFGYTASEAVGRPLDLIVPERYRGAHGAGLARVSAGGHSQLVGRSVELFALHQDGSEFPVELSLSMWRADGQPTFGAIIRNISNRRANEERLNRLAHQDTLTGLPNRLEFRRRLEAAIREERATSILVVDIDRFKEINDTLGHSAGDMLLMEVAARLVGCVAPTDTVARLSADEFAILLPNGGDLLQADKVADCLLREFSSPIVIDDQALHVGASIGIAVYPLHGEDSDDIKASADLALHQAKAEGGHCRRIFNPGLRRAAVSKQRLEVDLRRAVEDGEFELFYQPQVCAGTGELTGAEALLRWNHPDRGLQTPAAFIATLESNLLAATVGDWAIRSACRQAAAWRAAGATDFRVGVNLFGMQFRSGKLSDTVWDALCEHGLPASALELEITENIILQHDEAMIRPLQEMHEAGIGIAFDDYGTGYASLSLLKRYPLTRLKIDQSFVRQVCDSRKDAAIVNAVVQLGRAFDLAVIAEGVERPDQRDFLVGARCHELQGYLFGKPIAVAEFTSRFIAKSVSAAA